VQDVPAFRIGAVFSRSFSMLSQNALPFTLLIAIGYAPSFAVDAVIPDSDDLWAFVWVLLSALPYMVASAFVMYGVIQQLRGQRASIKACVAAGLQRFAPLLASSFVALVCMMVGFMVLLIPGILVMLMLWMTVPVAVSERLGAVATLERSRELTRGHKVRLLGIAIVIWSLMLGLGLLGNAVEEAVGGAAGFLAPLVADVFTGVVGAVITAVIYHDLRVLKDGFGVDDLVRVFE
jgi:hypothetical protein